MSRVFTQKLTHEELAEKIWNKALETEKECEWANFDSEDHENLKTFVEKCYASYIPIPYFSGKIHDDLKKVNFDWENYDFSPEDWRKDCGFKTISNGLTFLGVIAGGDWQTSVFSIIYFDGKCLRAYIPTNGNTWNTDTNEAYGNDNLADAKNIAKRFKPELNDKLADMDEYEDNFYDNIDFDQEKIIKDIEGRIKYKNLS